MYNRKELKMTTGTKTRRRDGVEVLYGELDVEKRDLAHSLPTVPLALSIHLQGSLPSTLDTVTRLHQQCVVAELIPVLMDRLHKSRPQ